MVTVVIVTVIVLAIAIAIAMAMEIAIYYNSKIQFIHFGHSFFPIIR